MAVFNAVLVVLLLAVAFPNGIESRPDPRVHHYRYKITSGTTHVNDGHDEDLTNYGANAGDTRKRGQDCGRGLIDKAANAAGNALTGAASGLENQVSGATNKHGLLNNIGKGLDTLFENGISGIRKGLDDAACGLGNIANEAASALDKGDIAGGVKNIAHEFFGGLENIGRDATGAFSNAAQSIASDAQNLG